MTYFPDPTRPLTFLLPFYPGEFVQASPGTDDDLVGRFTSPHGDLWLMADNRLNPEFPMGKVVAIINANVVTALPVILTELGPTRIRVSFAPGAELFLAKSTLKSRNAARTVALCCTDVARQLGMPFLPVVDLLHHGERPFASA